MQSETTSFYPRSPDAVAKNVCILDYREAYNIYAYNGISFNQE